MGTYTINCTTCFTPFMWWSGTIDQRCPACKDTRPRMTYGGYEITTVTDGVLVSMPDLFKGPLLYTNMDDAKKFIDYVNNNRDRWV